MVRAFNLEQEYTYLFTDVSGNEWYAGFIGAVSSCGIMNGDIGYFRPDLSGNPPDFKSKGQIIHIIPEKSIV